MWKNRIYPWILKRADDDRGNLGLFVAGAVFFFLGAGIIYAAHLRLPPSLLQEMIALAGVLVGISGAIAATIGYIGLSIFRLIRHCHKDDPRSF